MNKSCNTYEWGITQICVANPGMPESWHTHWRVMENIWMSHGTHIDESWKAYGWVMAHTLPSHEKHMNESRHTSASGFLVHLSHRTDVNGPSNTNEGFMSHISIPHMNVVWGTDLSTLINVVWGTDLSTHMNVSCHTWAHRIHVCAHPIHVWAHPILVWAHFIHVCAHPIHVRAHPIHVWHDVGDVGTSHSCVARSHMAFRWAKRGLQHAWMGHAIHHHSVSSGYIYIHIYTYLYIYTHTYIYVYVYIHTSAFCL